MKENQQSSNFQQENEAVQISLNLETEKDVDCSSGNIVSFEEYKQKKTKEEYYNDVSEMIEHLKKNAL
jgi:hypothetical protein